MRSNKYNARRSFGYDSQLEKKYGEKLELLSLAGKILDYQHHPPAVELIAGINWKVDYWVDLPDLGRVYVEVKGMPTPEFKMKWRIYKWMYDGEIAPDMHPCMIVQKGGKIWDHVGCEEIIRLNIL